MSFTLFHSARAEALAFVLSQLDSGSLRLTDLTHCRDVIRDAVEELRGAESRIRLAQKTMRDGMAESCMQGIHASNTTPLLLMDDDSLKKVAAVAYRQADAMLAVRDGGEK